MMSNSKRYFVDRLMEIYDKSDEELKRAMIYLVLMDVPEQDLRAHELLFGHGITPDHKRPL